MTFLTESRRLQRQDIAMMNRATNLAVLQALIREAQLQVLCPDTYIGDVEFPSVTENDYPYWSESDGRQMWDSLESEQFHIIQDAHTRFELWGNSLEYRALLCSEVGNA